MKNKIISVLMCLIIGCTAMIFTACGNSTETYCGDWSAESEFGTITIHIAEDGKASFDIIGLEGEGTWELNEDNESITVESEQIETFDLTEKDGKLAYEFAGDEVLLEKVAEE